jgi:ElaB/YqjD/DUF883 family membrane-anchored ribosome-binding protein
MNKTAVTTEKLINDFKLLMRDAEDLLKITAGDASDKAQVAREQLASALDAAKDSCQDLEQKAIEGMKAADQMVREHPYKSIGVAFGVGLLLAVLLKRD